MKPTRILLAAGLLAACAPAMQSAAVAAGNHPFVGSWKGTGEQSDEPGRSWSIAATIAPGRVGDVVGTIAYPSLQCGGDLELRSVSADSLVVREHITFGSCVDLGIVTLGYRRPGILSYAWRSETANLTAHGQLGRAGRPNH